MKVRIAAMTRWLFSFILCCAGFASADVIPNIPPGPNETNWAFYLPQGHAGPYAWISLEGRVDGEALTTQISGLEFITGNGDPWYGARWSRNFYNGKYPNGVFTSQGDVFTAPLNSNIGKIRFTRGLASYFSLIASIGNGMTLDAYNSDNVLVATSGSASANFGTGTVSRLTVERPVRDIAYVVITGVPLNTFIVDSFSTNAPGVSNFSGGYTIGGGLIINQGSLSSFNLSMNSTIIGAAGQFTFLESTTGRSALSTGFTSVSVSATNVTANGTCNATGVLGATFTFVANKSGNNWYVDIRIYNSSQQIVMSTVGFSTGSFTPWP